MSVVNVSFIIPALNEEDHIANVIYSIRRTMLNIPLSYQIIVVDNESSDKTKEIAQAQGAIIRSAPREYNISQVRNIGVEASDGDVFVFIDADILLDQYWGVELMRNYFSIRDEKIVTGAVYGVSKESSWITKLWYEPILNKPRNYINSGNLLVSRKLFDSIDGFDADLETGEDSDFSRRAALIGSKIINNSSFTTTHVGYPRTLAEFFRRERWHGTGNFYPLSHLLKTKTSMVIVFLWVMLLTSILQTAFTKNIIWIDAFIMSIIAMSVIFAYRRGGRHGLLARTSIALVWFIARGSSLFALR